jgi:hypothetical protein
MALTADENSVGDSGLGVGDGGATSVFYLSP